MSDFIHWWQLLTWSAALAIFIAVAIVLGVLAFLFRCWLRDMQLRGKRITREEIVREKITPALPNWALRDFQNRTYDEGKS